MTYDPLKNDGPGENQPSPSSYWHIQTRPSKSFPAGGGGDRGRGHRRWRLYRLSTAYFLADLYGIKPVVLEANSRAGAQAGETRGLHFARPVVYHPQQWRNVGEVPSRNELFWSLKEDWKRSSGCWNARDEIASDNPLGSSRSFIGMLWFRGHRKLRRMRGLGTA